MTWTAQLAQNLGCPESGLKLLLGQLSGYPLFLLYVCFLKKSPQIFQHFYFALTGILVSYWALGVSAIFHGSLCIIITFAVTRVFRGNLSSTLFLFFFQFGYLQWGYIYVGTETYDFSWTMPHCVMCLKLIGIAIDVFDGTKNEYDLSKDQKESALFELPSILEMFSHSFFIGGYFFGPQFSMRKFLRFIERNIEQDIPIPFSFAFLRFILGVFYLAGHVLGSIYIPVNLVETEEFMELGFIRKSLFFTLWAKVILAKYISMWLLAEGTLIVSGLAYNGVNANNEVLWNGGANVKLRIYEKATNFQHMIESFNIRTNAWVMTYVYKRLRFLNNRLLSQAGVLIFLALWHGHHSGYYVTFFHEFLIMNFEKQFFPMVENSTVLAPLAARFPQIKYLFLAMGKLYLLFFIPHFFVAFPLLKHKKYLPVMCTTYFGIFAFFGTWYLWKPLVKAVLRRARKERIDKKRKKSSFLYSPLSISFKND